MDYEEDLPQGEFLKALGRAIVAVIAAIAVASATGALASLNPGKEAAVSAAVASEIHERACIAQYGPGERFKNVKPACALGTRDVPATALSYPLAHQ